MEDTATISSTKSSTAFSGSAFEFPKFGMPHFEMPKMEIPAAFRELAEKGVSQAKENYEKMKSVAEEATDLLEGTYATASKGASEYGFKLIEAARVNTNAAFEFMRQLTTAKSPTEFFTMSSNHLRQEFETYTRQAQELASIAQKATTATTNKIKTGLNKAS